VYAFEIRTFGRLQVIAGSGRGFGKDVGIIRLGGAGVDSSGGIDIWLFDGKYQTRVERCDIAIGFVLGVESVLNHREDLQFQFASIAA